MLCDQNKPNAGKKNQTYKKMEKLGCDSSRYQVIVHLSKHISVKFFEDGLHFIMFLLPTYQKCIH